MKTLVVGDVHGCAAELQALCAKTRPDRVVLVGDLFTKGPDPAGVWALIRDGGWRAVLGNHDDWLLRVVAGQIEGDAYSRQCIAALDQSDPAWRDWLAGLPLFCEVAGFTVVHAGLHPSGSLADTTRTMAISMRRWPEEQPGCPYWHAQYQGARGVIFGHDAKRGLVFIEKAGSPWLVGLDTGCVYGKQLTGFIPETGQLLSVPAARVYQSVGR